MAVVPMPNIEPQGAHSTDEWELRSNTAVFRSPLTGKVWSLERGGAHWATRARFFGQFGQRRAQMQVWLASMRGQANRCYVPLWGWTRRGSFPATELLTNTSFESTSGWLGQNANFTVSDGILRMVPPALTPTPGVRQSPTGLVQYAPYALRSVIHDGSGTSGLTMGRFMSDGLGGASDYSTSRGYGAIVRVVDTASPGSQYPIVLAPSSGWIPNITYGSLSFASFARCALVDNGPNLLVRSDEFDNAAWVKSNITVSANATTAPNGTTTADAIVEASDVGQIHGIEQNGIPVPASAADYAFAVALKAGGRTWARISLQEANAFDAWAYIDLQNGVLGSVATDGAGWENVRAFLQPLGDGWYYCCVVGRKASAATDIDARIFPAEANGDLQYNGNGTVSIYAWRATAAQASVPIRLTQTTSASTSGANQTGGALHLKGLPASTDGLLLQGDPVEIITGTTSQLVRVRSSLNSDAAGLGYLEFEPPLRVSPSDNAAVIVQNPLCRMLLESNVASWIEHDGAFCDIEAALVEDVE